MAFSDHERWGEQLRSLLLASSSKMFFLSLWVKAELARMMSLMAIGLE